MFSAVSIFFVYIVCYLADADAALEVVKHISVSVCSHHDSQTSLLQNWITGDSNICKLDSGSAQYW